MLGKSAHFQEVHFHPSRDDMALFRKGDPVRMSRNNPDGPDFIEAKFLGLTEKGLSVIVSDDSDVRIGVLYGSHAKARRSEYGKNSHKCQQSKNNP